MASTITNIPNISSSTLTTDNTTGWRLNNGSSTVTLGNLNSSTIDSRSYIVQNGGTTTMSWNNDTEEIVEYLLFLTEVLDIDVPNFNEFKDMSSGDRIIKLRDIKIDKILK